MKYFLRTLLLALSLPLALAAPLRAEEAADPSVDEIVRKANRASYYQGSDGRAQVNMVITDSQGRTRERQFTILRRDVEPADATGEYADGDQKFYVYFHRPADVNKTVFMVWKHLASDDDRWLYLPALDLVKRIAASDERTSFVGSHFFYEDVSGRGIHEDEHEMVETTQNYFVLNHIPKNPDQVEFANYKTWIHRGTFLPVKTEYYNKAGENYRTYTAVKVDTVDGFPTVVQSKMEDRDMGGNTVISYERVTYNVGLPDDIFTERYLRNAPRQYLR